MGIWKMLIIHHTIQMDLLKCGILQDNGALMDIGTLANSTFYAVYAIGDSYGVNEGSALISANLTQPLLPADYDMYFRIGFVKTSGAAAILAFLS